jgi:hypothetical protein
MIDGTWEVIIATPIGRMQVVYEFTRVDGVLAGVARGKGEDAALHDIVELGDRVTWRQQVTKPMRLNLDFDVTVNGVALEGTSKAGRLPSSKVSGLRN